MKITKSKYSIIFMGGHITWGQAACENGSYYQDYISSGVQDILKIFDILKGKLSV